VRIWTIARVTLAGFLRNRVLILFTAVFVFILLSELTDLLAMRSAARHVSAGDISPVMGEIGEILDLVGAFGCALAAWSAADTVASEMKSGTILAVMARPVERWEFLLGKYLGVQLLTAIYVVFGFGFIHLLGWIGGQQIHTTPWVLIVYPLCRYAIYSSIAIFFVTFAHQIVAFGGAVLIAILASLLKPGDNSLAFVPAAVRNVAYVLLPSTALLSEDRFLTITKASLAKITWDMHAFAVAYGLNYAMIFFLLAVWSFRRRGLSRE